jgi:signal transduction histidine kinase/CheY-like chemotaxis protein
MKALAPSRDLRHVARTLAEVAQVLTASDRAEARVEAVMTMVHQLVPNECCALLACAREGTARLYAAAGIAPERRAVLQTRLTAFLGLLADGGLEPLAAASPTGVRGERAHLALPVVGWNQVLGVLFVEPADGEDHEQDLRLLSVVAAQLGSYLTALRLREEETEHARQLGEALQRLEETDRRKDEFLAMLGHELRNPVGAINNALRLLDYRSAGDANHYHQVIDRQIRHLSRIVDDLLDASRVRLGRVILERHDVDLRQVAERWFEAYGSTDSVRQHAVTLALDPEPVTVHGDPVRLEQVLSNLLGNALKYTPRGGPIDVRVGLEEGQGVLRVRDGGIGMSPEVLATVFDPFTQADDSLARSQGGLGLGLSLVRGLVEQHGGTVVAYSEGIGRGSELVVRLPLAAMAPLDEPRPAPAPVTLNLVRSLRILIIEDNDDARETLREILSIWEHEVACAADGMEGVAMALATPFDVLLVDIGIPKLDGYEVAREVRAILGERAPMLFAMTGYGQPEDRRRAMRAGFDAHLVKPVAAADLQERLATVARREP